MNEKEILKRRKKEVTEKAIREGGFYGKNGVWNSIITFSGDKRLYRERVETIILKDKKYVFVKKKMDGSYFLPGGSTEKDVSHMDQAVNECREEAHINVRNIQSTGITYKEKHETPNWAKGETDVEWQGTYSEVYVAEYDSIFKGHIDKVDEDPFIRSGKFYTTKECFKFFRKEHRDALLWYLKSLNQEEEPVTESYITNYFKNKILLRRISRNPEITRSSVDTMISILCKEYRKLSATSKIQRARKKPNVAEVFYPVLTFEFPDAQVISIFICFDDKEISDGVAVHTDDIGDMIIVYPCFFSSTKENQIFTLLHEIGHIRLHHLERRNYKTDIFGNDRSLEYRRKLMYKGKVMYPEVNADLYAVLNGAAMYTILSSAITKDLDLENDADYRYTNQELANRYNRVFKDYTNLRGYWESQFSKYDIASLSIYELAYENSSIDFLSEKEKDELYSILFEYGINNKIKDNKNIIMLEKAYKDIKTKYKDKYDNCKYIISNTMEDSGNKNSNINYLEESLITEADINETDIPEKKELLNLKNKVNEVYNSLILERSKVYDIKIDDIKINHRGNNPKMAEFSMYKSVFEKGLLNELNDMIYKLKIKRDYVTEKAEENKIDHYLYLIESLTSSERSKIPKDKFGIPETRSYPLDTKKHVESAIRLFGHCDKKYKKDLAENIFKAMKEFDISFDKIGKTSQLYKYMNK